MQQIVINSPVGRLAIREQSQHITHCVWTREAIDIGNITPLLRRAKSQLEQYFAGQRQCFDLALAPQGTAFQRSVWQALGQIPFGDTQSYSDIAQTIGNAKAVRAVGSANGKNPISIIIPCHRVIRASGEIGGYAGGITCKQQLLTLESQRLSVA